MEASNAQTEQDPLAKCRLSHSFFPHDLSTTPYTLPPVSPQKSDQEAADKQAWSLPAARASVLHAHSLLASKKDSSIYIHVFVRSSEWGGNARARWSLARRTYPYVERKNGSYICLETTKRSELRISSPFLCDKRRNFAFYASQDNGSPGRPVSSGL